MHEARGLKMMKRTLLAGLAILTLSGGVAAQDATLPQIEEYVVGMARPPIEPGVEVVNMSLDAAIDRALSANLNIQSARLDPVIQNYSLRTAYAAFTPTFSTNLSYNNSANQSTSQLDGGARTVSERITFNSSLSQQIPWYGGRLSANFNNSRNETNSAFATRNPSFSSSVNLSYTQPLLAGLSIDNQRAALQTQTIQSEITDLQLESQIESITAQVRQRYWALRASIEQIEIQRRSLEQAQEIRQQNQVRLEAGQATPYQVIQTDAQVASAEQALLNAEINWRNAELAFKQLLLDGADDELLTQRIIPSDLPTVVDQAVNLDAAIEAALGSRIDLRASRQQIDIAELNLDVTQSNALPDLSLSASYSLSGVGGDLFQRDQLGGDPILVQQGGYLDGLQSIADFDTPTWNLTLSGSYPLGTNSQKLNAERAELQLQKQALSLRTQELNVVTQVTSAGLAVRNTFLQYQAAVRNREAAEQNTAAELARLQVGVATNFEVVQAQNQLTSARLSELQSLINHVNAIANFDQVQRIGN